MKVVYCLDNLYLQGGIEHVTVVKANALAALPGYSVYILVLDTFKKPIYTIDERVNIVDLNINYSHLSRSSRIIYHIQECRIKILHFLKLKKVLEKLAPDVVISTGLKGCHLLQCIFPSSSPLKVREYHFPRDYQERQSFTVLSKIRCSIEKYLDNFSKLYGYDKIAVLTEADKISNWQGFDRKVVVIPNPILAKHDVELLGNKIVIAVGRLSQEKNFSELIAIWDNIATKYPEWTLQIWGDGWLRDNLQKQIQSCLHPSNVQLMGYTSNIINEMSKASIYAMTSVYEGFSLSLAQAMSVGLPVISYDCPYGPSSIITDGKDGFLVTLHDQETLAKRLCQLIDDEDLRERMGTQGKMSAKRYELNHIMSMWTALFASK